MTCELTHFAIGKHGEYRVDDPKIKLAALGVFKVTEGGLARRLLGLYPMRVELRWDESSSPEIVNIVPLWEGFEPVLAHPAKKPHQNLGSMGHVSAAIERSLAGFPEPMTPSAFDFGLGAGDHVPTETELARTWAVITGGIYYDEVLREFASCLAWFVGRKLGRLMPPKMLLRDPT